MSSLRRVGLCLAMLSLVPAALAGRAHAQAVPLVEMQVQWLQLTPLVSYSARNFVTQKVAEKLDSGLPQRIVTRVYAYPEKGEEPLAIAALSCRVVYDLWEGVYRVQQESDTIDRAITVPDQPAVMKACLDVQRLALGTSDVFANQRGKRIYVAAIIELNPLSPDTVQRIRRWLSKSGGPLRGDAFFGSFVSIFVSRRMGAAEHSVAFRSRIFSVPP